jgi:hypothetical protein
MARTGGGRRYCQVRGRSFEQCQPTVRNSPKSTTYLLNLCRAVIGAVYTHVIVQSKHRESQAEALESSKWLNLHDPRLPNLIIRESLAIVLGGEPQEGQNRAITGVQGILTCMSTFSDSVDAVERRAILKEWVVLAHHPAASEFYMRRMTCSTHHIEQYCVSVAPEPRQAWISMVQNAGQDPRILVIEHLEYILGTTLDAVGSTLVRRFLHAFVPGYGIFPSLQGLAMRSAAKLAATTLAFVAPDVVVQRLVERIREDLDSTGLKDLTELDYMILNHEEGQLVVDGTLTRMSPVYGLTRV